MKLVFNIENNNLSHRGKFLTELCSKGARKYLGVYRSKKYRLTFRTTNSLLTQDNAIVLCKSSIGLYWNWSSPLIGPIGKFPTAADVHRQTKQAHHYDDSNAYFSNSPMDRFLTEKFGESTVYGTFKIEKIT